MRRKVIIGSVTMLVLAAVVIFGAGWVDTQPIGIVDSDVRVKGFDDLPAKNRKIIQLIESKGDELAPTYADAVCTEFVIKVISNFGTLTRDEKNDIRIITTDDLGDLIRNDAPVIKGVQTALVNSNKGIAIDVVDVKPGDFVQFWDVYCGKEFGHCGVVLDSEPGKTLTVFSSHPLTNGYGKQKYLWPDKVFFARLQ